MLSLLCSYLCCSNAVAINKGTAIPSQVSENKQTKLSSQLYVCKTVVGKTKADGAHRRTQRRAIRG